MAADDIRIERRGGLGLIALNRPQALNTLSLAMYRIFDPQLVAWGRDPDIHAVAVKGRAAAPFAPVATYGRSMTHAAAPWATATTRPISSARNIR